MGEIRKVYKNGDSIALNLPAWWCKQRGLGSGDKVEIVLFGEDLQIKKVK